MALIPERALVALKAMKAIGFPIHVAKPVLKNLLKVYDNNCEYIEAKNYRVLADAILDAQESKDVALKSKMIDDRNKSAHSCSSSGSCASCSCSPMKTYRLGRQPAIENPGNDVHFKEPKIEPGTKVLEKNDAARHDIAFIRPKDEPFDDDAVGFETPVAMI